jgi:hypothetical protein
MAAARLPLSALLSKVLVTFAREFEEASDVSLAICSNVLRLFDDDLVLVREFPRRSGSRGMARNSSENRGPRWKL